MNKENPDWLKPFNDYEAACGGFGDNRDIMMQAFSYGWDMRTNNHLFEERYNILDQPFMGGIKNYKFIKIKEKIGITPIGVLYLGLWKKNDEEYDGYFISTGLLPSYMEELTTSIEEYNIPITYDEAYCHSCCPFLENSCGENFKCKKYNKDLDYYDGVLAWCCSSENQEDLWKEYIYGY